jgi:hypothetical protein
VRLPKRRICVVMACMDFDRLRTFVWTIEEGSISRATKRLYRAQPAVSRLLHVRPEPAICRRREEADERRGCVVDSA